MVGHLLLPMADWEHDRTFRTESFRRWRFPRPARADVPAKSSFGDWLGTEFRRRWTSHFAVDKMAFGIAAGRPYAPRDYQFPYARRHPLRGLDSRTDRAAVADGG
jgi:hypothetical protein